jgi:hypothetical protein
MCDKKDHKEEKKMTEATLMKKTKTNLNKRPTLEEVTDMIEKSMEYYGYTIDDVRKDLKDIRKGK